jgi:hypothetical protein
MRFRISGKDRRVPSPLNGEKVAEGRMRGGNTHDFGSCASTFRSQLTLPPLTPALSPLRGEGEHTSRLRFMSRLLIAPSFFGAEKLFQVGQFVGVDQINACVAQHFPTSDVIRRRPEADAPSLAVRASNQGA